VRRWGLRLLAAATRFEHWRLRARPRGRRCRATARAYLRTASRSGPCGASAGVSVGGSLRTSRLRIHLPGETVSRTVWPGRSYAIGAKRPTREPAPATGDSPGRPPRPGQGALSLARIRSTRKGRSSRRWGQKARRLRKSRPPHATAPSARGRTTRRA